MGRPKSENTKVREVERLYYDGYGDDEIAELLGIKEITVRNYRGQLGLTHRKITKKWLDDSGVGWEWDEVCRKLRGKR